MKFSSLFLGSLASLAAAQTAGPYTDAKSGISFNAFIHSSGYFFGLALPANSTGNTDFIGTIGGKGTGWSGVSLGGDMKNKLLLTAWPNAQAVVSSFRKTALVFASPCRKIGLTLTATSPLLLSPPAPLRRRLSPMAPTSTARTGRTRSSAPSASSPTRRRLRRPTSPQC